MRNIWNWIKRNWWKTILVIVGILVFFAFLLPLGRIGWQKYNAWITGMNSSSTSAPAVTAPASASPATAIDHGTWSLYGDPSFTVTAGNVTESGSDLFTDPSKGGIQVTINPTSDAVCLLQYGTTTVYDKGSQFSASFPAGNTGAGFRVISQAYWKTLPVSDGAYHLCWPRQ